MTGRSNKQSATVPSLVDGHADDTEHRNRWILAEQVKLVYARANRGFVISFLISAFLVAGLWDVVRHQWLLAWFGFMALVTLGQFILVRTFRRTTDPETDIRRWLALFSVGAGCAGVSWGLAGTLLFPTGFVFQQAFLAFLLGGMVAGAAPYLSAVMSAYVAFLLPALLPPAVLLLFQGGNIYVFMGLMMLAFSGAMLTIGRAIHLTIKGSLTLRFENITLTEGLSDAQMEANRASAELAAEIQERKRAQADLFLEKELAKVTLKSIGDGVITTNMDSAVKYLNPVAEQLTGWLNAEAHGLPLQRVLKLVDESTEKEVPDPVRRCLEEKRSVRLSGHSMLVHRDGETEISVEVAISPIRDHDLHGIGAVLVLHEASEMHGMARRMTYQASHDALTGLVNRHEFELRLMQALKSARTEDRQHALCYLDLDQFKAVNDMCGHVAGDALLRQLAAELQRGVRESDTLARLGGDEFGVLLEGCPLDQAGNIADGLRQTVQNFRFAWADRVFEVGISIGVVPITGDSGSITEVLSMADSACYMAKNRGRDRVHVHEPDDKVIEQRFGEMQWVSRIAQAIQEDRIDLFGQQAMPLSAKAKRCGYSEVLIRMQDENGEHVPTTAFLPAAKRYNLMPIIDRWVMRKVCAFLCDVGVTTSSDLGMLAINLSGQSLSDERFLAFVVDQLHQNSISPENICFEITETAAIADLTHVKRFISVLKSMGCRFALDDFGSGLSSFAYLTNLQVDYLKIDGRFVRDSASNPVDYAMVKIMRQIGDVMDIQTIAKHVEHKRVLIKLKELGVDYAQGFEIAEPVPLEECMAIFPEKSMIS